MKSNQEKSSRRTFLKSGVVLAGGAVAASLIKPFSGVVLATERPEGDRPWYGIGIDIQKCIGCGNCASSCKLENPVPPEPFYFRNWVEQYTVMNDGSVKVESPNGGIGGFTQTVPEDQIFKSFFVPKMCNHCVKSPCTQVCPVGAAFETPDGINLVDKSYCIGCGYCIQACPYGCRYMHPTEHVVDKCTLCFHRIKEGLLPACFEVCPTHARIFGNLNDPSSELVKFTKEHSCRFLKPHLNTVPKLYYNALEEEVR